MIGQGAGSGGAADAAGVGEIWDPLPVDLFDGQAIPQGGWMAADVAGYAGSEDVLFSVTSHHPALLA